MRINTRGRAAAGLTLSLALLATACGSGDASDDGGAGTGDTAETTEDAMSSEATSDSEAMSDGASEAMSDGASEAMSDGGSEAMTDGGSAEASGTVPIAGSSTVFPISQIVAEDFVNEAPDANAVVESTGTGGGFADNFCTGRTAINNASRAIEQDEIDLCAENDVTNILELQVGIDGIATLTSASNDSAPACLNFAEMYALVGPESGDVASWADANAIVSEIGEHASGEEFTDVPLTTSGPGTESGTYDSFIELALEGIAEEQGVEPGVRPDWTGNNDDNVIIQGIAGNQYSFGWVGFAYYTEIADQLTAFEVADEEGNCIAPTDDTIASGEYPLSRPLFIYVDLDKLEGQDYSGALEAFVDYYMSDAGYEAVAEANYVQVTEDVWAESQAAWEAKESNVG